MMEFGLPFGAFLAAILVLVPLPSHWRARNVSTISMIAWLAVVNVILGVNAIVWANNVEIQLVSWCDIVIRVSVGSNLALPAACFCLCMHLERVASVRIIHATQSDKRKRMIIDLLLCFGVPMIYIGVYYVIQGHRFDIVENFGCRAETYVSIPEFFLFRLPPILFSLGTFVFAGLAFLQFHRRRASFAAHLRQTTAALTPGRYFRLMSLAMVQMFWSLLVTCLDTWFSYRDGLEPWISWDNVHSDFSRIGQFPTVLIPRQDLIFTYFLWWTIPVSAYLFFIFFAFGQDAMREYGGYWIWIRRNVLRRDVRRSGVSNSPSLPIYSVSSPRFRSLLVTVTQSEMVASDMSQSPSSSKKKLSLVDGEGFSRTFPSPYDVRASAALPQEKPGPVDCTASTIAMPLPPSPTHNRISLKPPVIAHETV
ncbi:pheromone A receptor-domain-containing protein [Sparassis latifolia]